MNCIWNITEPSFLCTVILKRFNRHENIHQMHTSHERLLRIHTSELKKNKTLQFVAKVLLKNNPIALWRLVGYFKLTLVDGKMTRW